MTKRRQNIQRPSAQEWKFSQKQCGFTEAQGLMKWKMNNK